jgi:hypothetical protein
MEWTDTFSKIGIGLLVGFAAIAIVKIAMHNARHGNTKRKPEDEEK